MTPSWDRYRTTAITEELKMKLIIVALPVLSFQFHYLLQRFIPWFKVMVLEREWYYKQEKCFY